MKQTQRVEMNLPTALVELISEYQQQNFIKDRTSAVIELIRKGLQK